MKTIFGVKSDTPINCKLKNGHTMYDWVVRKNCYPAFCMRTLCGENKITAEEIKYLKAKGCKIGLVLNDLTEAEVSGISGAAAAERAVKAALELGVPNGCGIALFAEIKPMWSINHNRMISFASALKAQGFVAGFIANTDSSLNFNFDRQASHFAEFTCNNNYLDAVFMATEPKCDFEATGWAPYCPSASRVYHQAYSFLLYTPKGVMICKSQSDLVIYTLKRDDIPSLSAWIKKFPLQSNENFLAR